MLLLNSHLLDLLTKMSNERIIAYANSNIIVILINYTLLIEQAIISFAHKGEK